MKKITVKSTMDEREVIVSDETPLSEIVEKNNDILSDGTLFLGGMVVNEYDLEQSVGELVDTDSTVLIAARKANCAR